MYSLAFDKCLLFDYWVISNEFSSIWMIYMQRFMVGKQKVKFLFCFFIFQLLKSEDSVNYKVHDK